eukprot:gb/GEZJ01002072.1/.p1 GENE.gb/GEZJ01002072.1/~~gb/GEZJ01002072.1/.p1  ORF type:complete len:117 (+),score=5.36 gb/GEZJ01002072.1/:159-509(+)
MGDGINDTGCCWVNASARNDHRALDCRRIRDKPSIWKLDVVTNSLRIRGAHALAVGRCGGGSSPIPAVFHLNKHQCSQRFRTRNAFLNAKKIISIHKDTEKPLEMQIVEWAETFPA